MIMLFSRSRYDIILDLHFWKQLVLLYYYYTFMLNAELKSDWFGGS